MSVLKRLCGVAMLVNLLVVLNAIICIPPMVGTSVRDWRWAVAYAFGFTVIGVFSFLTQKAAHAASRRDEDAKRMAATVTISVAKAKGR